MIRSRTLAFPAALLGLAIAAGPAAAADGPTASTSGGTTTIKFLEKASGGSYTPKGGSPQDFPTDEDFVPSVGDAFTYTNDLLQGARKVGTNEVRCTLLKLETNTNRCLGTFTFVNGTMDGAVTFDVLDEAQTFDVTITSGTGAYDGATGTITVAQAEDPADPSQLTAVFRTDRGAQVTQVPSGGAATGGGAADSATWLFVLAGGAVLGGTVMVARGRALTERG